MRIAGIREWLRQPDVRRDFPRALWRRLRWRWHWRRDDAAPMRVRGWWRGMEIYLARSGSSAVAYYRDLDFDPIVRAMERLVRPGMTVLDVGAHAGAYTLAAAHFAGRDGRAIAVEPQPELAALIRRNANANRLTNVSVEECAIGSACGEVRFTSDQDTKGGWIACGGAGESSFTVPMRTLDAIRAREGRIDFIKLDAAGFEPSIIEGGRELLGQPDSPDVAVKFYNPAIIAERLGPNAPDLRRLLESVGYALFEDADGQWIPFTREVSEYGVVVLATRRSEALGVSRPG